MQWKSNETVVLQAISFGSAYALEIIERVKEKTSGVIVLKDGTLYPVLNRLEAGGFLQSSEQPLEPGRGGHCRKYYELTSTGMERARREREGLMGLLEEKR